MSVVEAGRVLVLRPHLRRAAACCASGALCFLSCAPYHNSALAWFALVPLLMAIHGQTPRRAFFLGWLCGVVVHGGGYWWLLGLLQNFGDMPLALALPLFALITLYQGLKYGLFGLALASTRGPLRAAALMVAIDFGFWMPFPGTIAMSQAAHPLVIQVAELGGAAAVMFVLVAVNAAIAACVVERPRPWGQCAASAALVAATLLFGYWRIGQVESWRTAAPKLRVGLVQNNTPLAANHQDYLLAPVVLRRLQAASAALQAQGAQLVVWSETEYPYNFWTDQQEDWPRLDVRLVQGFSVPVLAGAPLALPDKQHRYNSAVLLAPNGHIQGHYDKNKLVPFGEYIPLVGPWLGQLVPNTLNRVASTEVQLLPLAPYKLGALICLEDILPQFTRRVCAQGPTCLINLTNDAWFGDSGEPQQHMALSVFRTVEERLDLARCTKTGVSAFIDASGQVRQQTAVCDPYASDRLPPPTPLMGELAQMQPCGLFSRLGDAFSWLMLAISLLLLAHARHRT